MYVEEVKNLEIETKAHLSEICFWWKVICLKNKRFPSRFFFWKAVENKYFLNLKKVHETVSAPICVHLYTSRTFKEFKEL